MKALLRTLALCLGLSLCLAAATTAQTSDEELFLEYQELLARLAIVDNRLTKADLVRLIDERYVATLIERITALPESDLLREQVQIDLEAEKTNQPKAPELDLLRQVVINLAADQILIAAFPNEPPEKDVTGFPLEMANLRSLAATKIRDVIFVSELLPELAALPQPKGSKDKTALDRWSKVVSVRLSFLDKKKIGKPAEISWLHFSEQHEGVAEGGKRDKYDVQGALIFDLTPDKSACRASDKWCASYEPVLVYEANLSTDATDKRDTITHRLGLQAFWGRQRLASDKGPGLGLGHGLTLTADYRTDRDYRSEVVGGTLQYSPTATSLGIGRYRAAGRHGFWRWQPYLVVEYGDVRDPGESEALAMQKSFTNASLRLTFELKLGARLKLTATETLTREFDNQDRDHSHLSASARWILGEAANDRVALVTSFDNGRLAPEFKRVERLKVSLGFKL